MLIGMCQHEAEQCVAANTGVSARVSLASTGARLPRALSKEHRIS